MKMPSILEDILFVADRIRLYIATVPTCMLVNLIIAATFVSGGIGFSLIKYFPAELRDFTGLLLSNTLLFFWGCIGVLGITRKEGLCHFGEWIHSVTQGVPAILMGLVIVLMTWGFAAYITFVWITEVFSR